MTEGTKKEFTVNEEDVLFKSPFVDRDPHSTHIVDNSNHADITEGASAADEPAGIFKGNFNVGKESQQKANSSLDPMAPEPATHNLPRRSVVNPKPLPINFNAQRLSLIHI